jgi:type II secretory pathway component PulF
MPSEAQINQARFWRKLQKLTRGRIDIFRAMEVIVEEENDPDFKAVLETVNAKLREGNPLSLAMEDAADRFSKSVRELVRSAEMSGAWDEILPIIADGLEDGTFG